MLSVSFYCSIVSPISADYSSDLTRVLVPTHENISLQDKQLLLQQWVENEENCQRIEAQLQVSREQKGEYEKGRELLTIGEMQQRGFSQSPALIISSILVLLISLEHKWW